MLLLHQSISVQFNSGVKLLLLLLDWWLESIDSSWLLRHNN
jgi:hypothetical protein